MKDKDYLRYLEVIEMHMVDLLPDVDLRLERSR